MRIKFRTSFSTCLLLVLSLATNHGPSSGELLAQIETFNPGLPAGFKAEVLYSVPSEMGSWVSMTADPQGRLIVSDQYGSLYRISVQDASVNVEKMDVQIGFAQGLLYAFDSLYVVAHPSEFKAVDSEGQAKKVSKTAGLYRLQDTTGDGRFDEVKLLRKFEGQGEHGPHAVILSPDKKSLYICAGNHTKIPNPETSRVPEVWREDQITPRLPDAGGHAVGIKAPGGWVCRTDPEGSSFELVSIGFRNEYDIAFSPDGELFTYDADMEWDIGLPWYRPTRVCHVTSGSEFGWRNGSGKWPACFPDSLPPVIDIGPGSPTGITFGTGAKFPAEYQNSLFIADWSYGIIYRIELENNGATYLGTKHTFCTAPVLPVTDMIINPKDGALYFLTGGRRSQSKLYRISYIGDESTVPAIYPDPDPLVELRRKLEALHERPAEKNIDVAWPFLSHQDRFVRFAARTAIELVDGSGWHDKAFSELDIQAKLEALLAVIRTSDGSADVLARVADSLNRISFGDLDQQQQLHLLRLHGLLLTRWETPSDAAREVVSSLSKYYPAESDLLNRELARVLAAAETNDVVEKTIELMKRSTLQQQQIHYAIAIHRVETGWTDDLRQQYLQWFVDSARYAGGSSFRRYLKNIRDQFAGNQPEDVRERFKELMSKEIEPVDPYADLQSRPTIRKWSMEDFKEIPLENRDIANGKKMFAIAQCYKCHIVNGEGGIVGPDITNAGRRFSPQDMLESILNPDKEVSDQYQATMFRLEDGQVITGRIANLVRDQYMIVEDMIRPGDFTTINADEIEAMKPSKISMMPAGLLDSLNRAEILDLLAYLKSAADNESRNQ